jgi:phosphomannomutase
MSAHHYFRDFAYCDSGMIPWLLVSELISKEGKSLSKLVEERQLAFPCSGEINFTVVDIPSTVKRIRTHFMKDVPNIDETDGVSLEFDNWRMNIRGSNTEPLLRLNIESRGDESEVQKRLDEIRSLI